ncbi:SDR family NAD(P)-dependent oxidoreductase [Pseudonocardia sp. HH130629-09]|uniref:SDR family NAD(P)-dependent oxidoreductase n=1 Tax=Pseudonocardia sp. HH130629-09 TaxID=1641402 RepID=UPI0011AE32CA|nr:SDR family NAD(P)-dependent oxidoreductase [Pseudonocardia sp. HH130629-09]
MEDLNETNALVTGGSRGIGRAIVGGLAARGASVVFGYVADEKSAADVVRSAETTGATVSALRADMADPDAVRELVHVAADRLGGLNVLINNAAVVPPPTSIAQTTDEEYDRVMAVNARGVFVAMREAALRMRDGGCIVNISSVNTVLPSPGVAALSTAGWE